LRLRLTLWFVFGVVVIALAGGIGLNILLSSQLRDRLDSELSRRITHFSQVVGSATDEQTLVEATKNFLAGPQSSALSRFGYVLSLQTIDGTVISNSQDIRLEDVPASQELLSSGTQYVTEVTFGGDPYRVIGTPVLLAGEQVGAVAIAGSMSEIRSTMSSLLLFTIIGGVLGCMLVGLGSWFLLGRALAPVRRITETAAAISREDLSRRIEYQGPRDEIGELAGTMDGMLDRLQSAFQSQDRFISDVSHELRTPLTIVKGHLQVLDRQDSPPPDVVQQEHALVIEELDRMDRLVSDLLTVARSTRVDFLRKESIDADVFLESLVSHGRHLDRTWIVDSLPGGSIMVDQTRLTQVFLNLMQNAVSYTSTGQVIALGGDRADGVLRMWVRDEGEGMSKEAQSRAFERFYRGTPGTSSATRTEGLGLGLALAKAIVEAHGGTISIESEVGKGSRFLIVLS